MKQRAVSSTVFALTLAAETVGLVVFEMMGEFVEEDFKKLFDRAFAFVSVDGVDPDESARSIVAAHRHSGGAAMEFELEFDLAFVNATESAAKKTLQRRRLLFDAAPRASTRLGGEVVELIGPVLTIHQYVARPPLMS